MVGLFALMAAVAGLTGTAAAAPEASSIENVAVVDSDSDLQVVVGTVEAQHLKCRKGRKIVLQVPKPGGGWVSWDTDTTDNNGGIGLLTYPDDIAEGYRIRLPGSSECGGTNLKLPAPFLRVSHRREVSPSTFGNFEATTAGPREILIGGRVAADRAACRARRSISLQIKNEDGVWITIRSDVSSDNGAIGLIVGAGRLNAGYRVRMPNAQVADADGKHTCTGANYSVTP